MNLSICNLDSSMFVNGTTVPWAVQAIDSFCKEVSESDLKKSGLSSAPALAYYAKNVYDDSGDTTTVYVFDKNCIMPGGRDRIPGTGNINTFSSWCRLSGLLYDQRGLFGLSEIASFLLKPHRITICEFAFVLLAKQWIRVNKECFRPLLSVIDILTDDDGSFIQLLGDYTQQRKDIAKKIQSLFFKTAVGRELKSSDVVSFNRFDTLRNCLVQAGIMTDKNNGFKLTAEGKRILTDYRENESRIKGSGIANGVEFYEYMSSIANGAFSLIDEKNAAIYETLYPNLAKLALLYDSREYNTVPSSLPLAPRQRIFFGAPGTGKSYRIKGLTKNESVIRTTFHPDSDYSSFVGSYKPTMRSVPIRDLSGEVVKEGEIPVCENRIVYEFRDQAFLQAYIKAWSFLAESGDDGLIKKQYLIIEEINRGNCAQIFGDIFQLLDRNKRGFSEYPVTADHDIQVHLKEAFSTVSSFPKYINSFYPDQFGDVSDRVHSGEVLVLPCNLYIWATMNTSDQSLFPMDSAFKRRWEQEFVKIDYNDASTFILKIGEERFNWDSVLHALNRFIEETDHSAHKVLGNRFVQTRFGSTIEYSSFRDKVLFYLFNDVFKDDDSFAEKFFAGRKGYLFFEDLYENDDVQISIDFIKSLLAEDSAYKSVRESSEDSSDSLEEDNESSPSGVDSSVEEDTTTQVDSEDES